MAKFDKTVAERAVDSFLAAQEELTDFISSPDTREILQELERLVTEHNSTLDTAVRRVKSQLKTSPQQKLIISGIGAQKKLKRWYDIPYLAKTLTADQSEIVLTEKISYDLDVELLEKLSRQGEIDATIVAEAYHEELQNPAAVPGTPKPYSMPAIVGE